MKMTKKILSIVLVVMMLFSVSMVATSAYTAPDGFAIADKNVTEDKIDGEVYGFVGDSDMNDSVNVRDATLIQKFAAELISLNDYQKVLADVNFDGKVNVKDATVIRKVIADMPVDAPVGQLIYTSENTDKPTDPTTPTNPEEEQKIASDYVLHGNFADGTNWADVVLYKASADATVASAVIEVAAGSYAFVIHNVATDAWLKNGGVIENTCEGWTFSTDDASDTVFNAKGGKYTFIFDLTTLKLTVVEGEEIPTTPGEDDPEPKDTYTIYFTKPEDWADAYIYGFYGVEGGESNGDWPTAYPGAKMNFFEKNEYGQDVYTYEVPKDIDYIKFCDGSDANRRTNNVPKADIKDGRGYYLGESVGDNKWAVLYWDTIDTTDPTTSTPATTPVVDKDTYTVYFIKPADWTNAYIYGFYGVEGGEASGEWPETYPGAPMNYVEDNEDGLKVYSYDVPKNVDYIKFTDGGSSDNKRTENVPNADIANNRLYEVDFTKPTEGKANSWAVKWTDLVIDDPEIPATGDEATKDEATKDEEIVEPKPDSKYVLMGSFDNWTEGYIFGDNGDGTVTVTIELAANTYEFKITDGEKWYGNGGTVNLAEGTCENWGFREKDKDNPENDAPNCTWIAAEGTYTIVVDVTDASRLGVTITAEDAGSDTPDDPDVPDVPDDPDNPVTEGTIVYFIKPADWNNAYIHLIGNPDITTYPGTPMELVEGDKYSYEVPAEATEIKFTDGNAENTKRTENVLKDNVVEGRTFEVDFDKPTSGKENSWAAKWDGSDTPVDPDIPDVPDVPVDPDAPVVYFVNTANWAQVAAYTFNEETLGGWPGTQMTKTGDQVHGFDVYKISVPGTFEKIIFNNNNNGSQTENLDFAADKYFDAKGNVYNSLSDVPAPDSLSTGIYIAGSFNSWSTSANEFMRAEAGSAVSTVTLSLAAGTEYEFKVVNNGSWTSPESATTITGTVSGIAFSGNADNVKLTTTVAGEYTFTWSDAKLSVTYPATNGWMIDIDGTAKLLQAGDTEGVYIYEVELKPSTDGHKIKVIDATGATEVTYGNASTYTDETKLNRPNATASLMNMVKDAVALTLKTTGGNYKITVDTTGTAPKIKVEFVEEIDYTTPTTIYFIKPADWDDAYIYLMDASKGELTSLNTYPGIKMTLVEGDKYTFEVPTEVGYIKFVDGPANRRTENIAIADVVEGRVFKIGTLISGTKWNPAWD